jgi:hypothetical protein
MADKKIESGRSAPCFVNAERAVERSYTGPADPVALWAEAAKGVPIGEDGKRDRRAVLEAYLVRCAGVERDPAPVGEGKPDVEAVTLGSVGITALGEASSDASPEVA